MILQKIFYSIFLAVLFSSFGLHLDDTYLQTLPLSPLLVLESFGQVLPQGVQTPLLQASDDSAATDEDHSVTIDVLANDSTLVPGQVTVVSVTLPSHGTALINPDSTITYTPNQDFFGSDSFEYTATYEVNGIVLESDAATVFVTINPVNDAPVANDDSAVTDEDNIVIIDVLANDFDVDGDPLKVSVPNHPPNGIIRPFNDGTIGYSPNDNFFGSDSFAYTISDGNGGTDTATVTITVNPVNDVPVAADDSAQTLINRSVTIDVLANDSDPDGDSLSVTSTSTPSNGTAAINANNTITYSPDQDFVGDDSFTYSVSDGNGGTDTATVTVTVSRTLATVSTCCKPWGVDININTNTIYVRAASIVSVIDGTTDTITQVIDSGFRPGKIAVNDATNMVYATVDRFIQVINGTDNTTIDFVDVADQAFISSVDVNPGTNMIYVALRCLPCEPNKVIDGDTNDIVDTIPNSGSSDVAVNPVTNMIYFAEGNTVVVVDGTTNTVVERIRGIPGGPIDVNPHTNMIYVADPGDSLNPVATNVAVIDGNTNTIVTEVLVGTLPRGIAVNEVTNMIYVTNNADDTVSVIDGEENHVVDTIPIRDGDGGERDGPQAIAVNSETNKVYVANFESNTITVLQGIGR